MEKMRALTPNELEKVSGGAGNVLSKEIVVIWETTYRYVQSLTGDDYNVMHEIDESFSCVISDSDIRSTAAYCLQELVPKLKDTAAKTELTNLFQNTANKY